MPTVRWRGTHGWDSPRNGSTSSSVDFHGSCRWLEDAFGSIFLSIRAMPGQTPSFITLIHLYISDIEAVSEEFDVAIDEEGLAGRECDLEDPDGNRLRVATPRS